MRCRQNGWRRNNLNVKFHTFTFETYLMKYFISIILFFGLLFFGASCFKETSYENSFQSTAKGSLQKNNTNECFPKIVVGVYEAGMALNSSNYISVDIDVTTIGSYVITTDIVNGYSFAGSGSFTDTGIQTIKIFAEGKPILAETDKFEIRFDNTICRTDVIILPNGAGGPAVFTLQGAGGNCTNAIIKGSYVVSAPLNVTNTVALTVNVSKIGSYSITTVASNGIVFRGTGIFSAIGAQSILLTGSGTPITNTSTTVSVTAGGGNCSFLIPISTPAAITINCSSAVLSGNFEAGVTLPTGNTVALDVTVISPGGYTISTNPVNGIVFSGSGTVTSGSQVITLTASGTPLSSGNFNIPVSFGSSSCSFPLVVTGAATIDWTFTEGAQVTYRGSMDTSSLNTVASINVFSYNGSSANEDIFLLLSDIAGGIQDNEIYSTNTTSGNGAGLLFISATETYTANNTTNTVNLVFKVTTHNKATKTIQGIFSGSVLDTNSAIKYITNGQFRGTY